MARKAGLGRGLAALLGESEERTLDVAGDTPKAPSGSSSATSNPAVLSSAPRAW